MSKLERWVAFAVAVVCYIIGAGVISVIHADQQFSGGTAVTVTSGSITANAGTGPATPWKVDLSATGANTTPIKVDGSAVTQPTSLASLPSLAAGTAKIGVVYPWTNCGNTAFETGSPAGMAAMPTSSSAVAAATTCVTLIVVSNTTGAPLTYTISDNAGTPLNFLNAVTINAGERDTYPFDHGFKFNAGIKVVASGAGLNYYINGLQ